MRGRPVRASSATLSNPVEYAVDGYRNTFWDSGDPARSWIQVDLGRPATVARLEFEVYQDEPDLPVRFLVLGQGPSGGLRLLASFHRETLVDLGRGSPHVFRYSAPRPWRDVRRIRIVTRASSGVFFWKELRAYSR